MIRVATTEIKPGMELARPIPHPETPEQNLLERGFGLTKKEIDGLVRFRVRDCWIRNERLAFLDKLLPEEIMDSQRRGMVVLRESFEKLSAEQVLDLPLKQLESSVSNMLSTMRTHPMSFAYMEALTSAGNELAAHGSNTCYLSLVLGLQLESYIVSQRKSLGYNHASETANLGLGGLLHDIGRLRLPDNLRRRRGNPLSREEADALRQHPETGFEMVRHNIEPSAANVVLNHHQRWDGQGYPLRAQSQGDERTPLSGAAIPVFSRIAAMANHYAASTQEPHPEGGLRAPVQAIFEMRFAIYSNWFDPEVEKVFYNLVPPFPVGSRVKLNTGETAAVIDFNPRSPCQPTVIILTDARGEDFTTGGNIEINLNETPDIYIKEYEGQDVTRYLF